MSNRPESKRGFCRAKTRRCCSKSSRRGATFASIALRAWKSSTANRKRWPARQPQRYVRGVQPRTDGLGYELIPGQIDEGYSLEISPLMSLDGQTVDAAVNCQVDQVEKLVPVVLDVPVVGQGPRVQIQVPQLVSWRLNERFRWPTDQVLLLSCGVVANPAADAGSTLARDEPVRREQEPGRCALVCRVSRCGERTGGTAGRSQAVRISDFRFQISDWWQAGRCARTAVFVMWFCLAALRFHMPAGPDCGAGEVRWRLTIRCSFRPWNASSSGSQAVDAVDDYFRIEREERVRLIGGVLTEGRIDTFPIIGSTIFEPWRKDSTPGYEKVHATLQSIRRRARSV